MANQPPRIPDEDPLLAEARRLPKRASDIAGDTTGKRRAMPPENVPGATDDALLRQARETSAAAEHMEKTIRRLARQAPGGEAAKQTRDVLQALHHTTQAGS